MRCTLRTLVAAKRNHENRKTILTTNLVMKKYSAALKINQITKRLSLLLLTLMLLTHCVQATNKKNHWILITLHNDTLVASNLDCILDGRLFYAGPVCGSILRDSVTSVIHVCYPHYGRNIAIGITIGSLARLVVGLIAAPPPEPYNGSFGAINETGNFLTTVGHGLYGSGIGILAGSGTETAISFAKKNRRIMILQTLAVMTKS